MTRKSLRDAASQKRSGWHGSNHGLSDIDRAALGLQPRKRESNRGKNLKKDAEGNFINQHNVMITPEERREFENLVKRVNRLRDKMLKEEAALPRMRGGEVKEDSNLPSMVMNGHSDFIISRHSRSLQKFKSRESFERELRNVRIISSPEYLDKRTEMYRDNYIIALQNVYEGDADDIIEHIENMSAKEFRKLLQKDELMDVSYHYEPSERQGKLNELRTFFGITQQEEEIPDA